MTAAGVTGRGGIDRTYNACRVGLQQGNNWPAMVEPLNCAGEARHPLEPTHGEILRAIGLLEGKIESLLTQASQHTSERASLGERVGNIEKRQAQTQIQMIILGAVLLACLPLTWSEISGRLKGPDHPPAVQPARP